MSTTTDHRPAETHRHTHGPSCGHESLVHGDHVDYLHDGHVHREHTGDGTVHYDECTVCACGNCTDSCAVCTCSDCTCATCNHAVCACGSCADNCANCVCSDCSCATCTHAA